MDEAVATLAAAFERDQFTSWVISDADARRRGLRELFGALLPEMLGRGGVLQVTPAGEAAALWYPPDFPLRFEGPRGARPEVAAAFEAIGAARPSGRCWFLDFIGAREGGRGHGSALLRCMHERLDAQGAASALWTGAERNLAFYGRHGYRLLRRLDFAGASAWWLWRDPA